MRRAWKWDRARRSAARLVATGGRAEHEIAAAVGVCRRTLFAWRHAPEFQARVNRIIRCRSERRRRETMADLKQFIAAHSVGKRRRKSRPRRRAATARMG